MVFEGSVWVPDRTETFKKGKVVEALEDGKKYRVRLDGSDRSQVFEAKDVQRCNPPSFEKCDDMASLTFLNEPSVVSNLKLRYEENNIYTYSGLFLVAVNPYKELNIYNQDFIRLYKDSRKKPAATTEQKENSDTPISLRAIVKPHIFSISEEAYQYLLRDNQDQSILVTGESGAGKTENTKKVIQYILNVSTSDKNKAAALRFENQIMQANPILESFGNATTVRNLNSSRFGKFVKINVLPTTKELTGAHIDWYLLEKSRVVMQDENERNYHIFYELLKGASTDTLSKLGLSRSINRYTYLQNDKVKSINDQAEFANLENAFDIMNFGSDDKLNVYKVLSIILHLGNITFRNSMNDTRQAILSDESESAVEAIAKLLQVPAGMLKKAILTSKARAGREIITQSRTASQAKFAVDALSKSLYERLFQYLVDKINENFDTNTIFTMEKANYIGILDIAGFEIFKKNSFEQLCINYTNEKLQQFFNHHMFVLEQSEYLKEGISWKYIDFGHELKPTIELIEGSREKKCNIFSILDEECIVPKGTDQSFLEKLFDELESKDRKAEKKKLSFKPNKVRDGFVVKHYAGEVSYSVDGWLDKNKDPLSSTMVDLLSDSKNIFISDMFESQDKLMSNLSSSPVKGGKQRRSGIFRTVAQRHKEQLTDLMQQLSRTHPHFVRCILPNSNKAAGEFNNKLVLEQLRCNGVLEGIRIARSGYPNRITFEKFAKRYALLADDSSTEGASHKHVCELILKDMNLDPDVYKVGLTKLFFRNGVLASLEKDKQAKLNKIITRFEAMVRGTLSRNRLKQKIAEYRASKLIIHNFKNYGKLAKDPWFRLISQLKPTLLDSSAVESHYIGKIQKLESKITDLTAKVENEVTAKRELQAQFNALQKSISNDRELLDDKDKNLASSRKKIVTLEKDMQEKVEMLEKLEGDRSSAKSELQLQREKLGAEISELQSKSEEQLKATETLKEEVKMLKTCIEAKEKEITNTKRKLEDNRSNLDKSLKETETRLREITVENRKLKDSVDTKEASVREYKLAVREKESELARAKAELDRSKATSITEAEQYSSEEVRRMRVKYKQMKHDFAEVKNLLDDKINDEIDFDKGKQKYVTEIAKLRDHLSGLKQELELEKKLSSDLQAQLKDARSDNERLLMMKKSYDVKLAELNFRLSSIPKAAPMVFSGDAKVMHDEMEMLQTRLAAESYENRQLRARLRKGTGDASLSDSTRLSVSAMASTKPGSDSAMKNELLLERAANKRLERLNVELQKQLLQQKNNTREIHGLERAEDDYHTKYQLAQMQIQNLQDRLKQSQLPSEQPLRDATRNVSNIENVDVTMDPMGKESLIMRQENLRLSSRLNETQTKLKRLQLTSDSSFVQQEEMAKLKMRLKIIGSKNVSLQESVDFYKARAENYFNKIEAAEVAVQSAKRARDMAVNELDQTKLQLEKAQDEFKLSDANVAKLNARIRDTEKELADKLFELRKLQEAYSALKEKHENAELLRASTSSIQTQSRDKELKMMNEDLIKSMNKETDLGKQIKNITIQMEVAKRESQSLKFSNVELNKEKDRLTKLLNETISSRNAAQTQNKEYSMKVSNLSSQIKAFKTANDDLLGERNNLLESKRALEKKVADISAEFEKHLEKVKTDASNAVSVIQLSTRLKESGGEIAELRRRLSSYQHDVEGSNEAAKKMRDEALMVIEENKALTKYNIGLKSKIEELQGKYEEEMHTQDDHWTNRVQELEDKIYMSNATKRDDEQRVYNLQRTIKNLEQQRDMQETSIKRSADQIEYLQQTVNRMESSISELQRKDAENVLKLKRSQREIQDSKERALTLEKELLEWRAGVTA
ncbi:DEKNAAC100837 [Brettanomyces naardenensis]|uniref:DEKNAAC100837 n=1 Tax=Brettanomyces naardenensis TaxID=13370 RepID=A0A448YFD1_BRENA|nr:DEKNAAC100837 [Brettanomyces naardenensis]